MGIECAVSFGSMESSMNHTTPRLLRLVATLAILGCHGSNAKTTTDAAPALDGATEKGTDGPTLAYPSDAATEEEVDEPNADAIFDAAAEKWAGGDAASERFPDAFVPSDAIAASDTSVVITAANDVGLAVWGSGPGDIWTGGKGGSLRHWDGTTWSDYPFFPSTCLVVAIWGASSNSVWAAGCTNTVAFWDGSSWKAQQTPTGSRVVMALQGTAADDVWIGGCQTLLLHWDGKTWTSVDGAISSCIQGFWLNDKSDGWLVTVAPGVSHWDGVQWNAVSAVGIGSGTPTAIYSKAANEVWVATFDGLYHFDGTRWGVPPVGMDMGQSRGSVFAMWGRSANDLYAGSFTAWHFDGTSWTPVTSLNGGTVRGIWGAPVGETWFVGDSGFLGRLP
jgi:hypothetical protein